MRRSASCTACRGARPGEIESQKEHELTNIIARRDPAADPRVLLGSRYDTRLWAEEDPDISRRNEPIPGANDGTSGVAVLLELLRGISETPALRGLGVDVVVFDGEEFGRPGNSEYCKGSIHFVRRLRDTYPSAPPIAAIILDMVGDRSLRIHRERSSNAALSRWLNDEIWRLGRQHAAGVFVNEPIGPIFDDQSVFHSAGISAVLLIDLEYPHWHTHSDTVDEVTAASPEAVGRTLVAVLQRITRAHGGEQNSPRRRNRRIDRTCLNSASTLWPLFSPSACLPTQDSPKTWHLFRGASYGSLQTTRR